MAVRFVIGRAGSGKTRHCIESIRSRLQTDPVDGPHLILLVPEQASQQMERAILISKVEGSTDGKIAASHRAEVLSFQRLADRILETTSSPSRMTLSEAARVMVLRHLVSKHHRQLAYYRRVERHSGLFERLAATIAELIQEGVSPDKLQTAASQENGSGHAPRDVDPTRAAKFHDLALIYAAYLAQLGPDRMDPSQHLELAREHMARCMWIQGAELWVDGFASLSGQEAMTLAALARLCAGVDIAVLLDPSSITGSPRSGGADRLFGRTLQTCQSLRRMFLDAGITELPPLILAPRPAPRFARNEVLAHLERRLFLSESPHPNHPRTSAELSLVELPSRRVEVEYAVARICEWTRRNPPDYRCRDIALIVRDLEPYHELVCEALESRNIPYFLDRRRPTAHHPLVGLLRAAAAIVAQSMSLESVRLLLKTGLLPLARDLGDELENYLLAHGIQGVEAWYGPDWSFRRIAEWDRRNEKALSLECATAARINASRRVVAECLSDWLAFAARKGGITGAQWAAALQQWLARLGVGETVARWAEEAEKFGDIDQAEQHRQVWTVVAAFLDDLAAALGDQQLTLDELAGVLEAGLSGLTLGLVPPTVDQVLVGSIERSRHPEIKAAIILGFNDGVFPARVVEDTMLNDDDREALLKADVPIGLPARRRAQDEAMLVYIAMTRASKELLITYARADEDGKTLRPSPYVTALINAVPALKVNSKADPARTRQRWDIQTPGDLRRRLALEFRVRPLREVDDHAVRSQWNGLYESGRILLREDAPTRTGWSSLGIRRHASLASAGIERLFAGTLRTSVSQLETYAACPFRYFTEHLLRLRERPVAEIASVDVGSVVHAILEDFAKGLMARHASIGGVGESDLMDGLRATCDRVAAQMPRDGELFDPKNAFILRNSASQLARVIRAQRRANAPDRMRPHAAELSFGMADENSLPALEVSTPDGRRVLLRGRIDRIDVAEAAGRLLGVVVDYKDMPDKKLQLAKVFHGLSLQLTAYLLVLAERGLPDPEFAGRSIQPAGALYVSLAPHYHKVTHPAETQPRVKEQEGTYRARGILNGNCLNDLGLEPVRSEWVPHYAVYFNKNGDLGNIDKCDAAAGAAFDAVLHMTRTRIGELADGILGGAIDVRPYRLAKESPCSWCRMASVCRFEMGLCGVRYLDSLKRSEVFRRLAAEGPASDASEV